MASAEVYSPAAKTFTAIAPMTASRQQHTATLLPDHRVFIASGYGTGFGGAELFDPATNTFTAVPQGMRPHAGHTATLLQDGRVLLAGGGGQNGATVDYADLFEPADQTFTPAGTMTAFRVQHTATLLADGSVLLAGGLGDATCCGLHPPQATLERYVPGSGFSGAGAMSAARNSHTATTLPDGTVLFAGSWGWSQAGTQSVEIYQPATAPGAINPDLPDGTRDNAYGPVTLGAAGGAGGPYTWSLLSPPSALPPGLGFDTIACPNGCIVTGGATVTGPTDLGRISGTPTAYGSYTFEVRIADAVGHVIDQTLRVRVNGLDITSPLQLADAHVGQPYSATLTATGVGPWTWKIAAFLLPAGLTLNGDTISGTPTGPAGYSSFTVAVVDSIGQRAVKSIAINVLNP